MLPHELSCPFTVPLDPAGKQGQYSTLGSRSAPWKPRKSKARASWFPDSPWSKQNRRILLHWSCWSHPSWHQSWNAIPHLCWFLESLAAHPKQDEHPWDPPTPPSPRMKQQNPLLSKPTPPAPSLAARTHAEFEKELQREKPALNWEWSWGNAGAGWIRAPFPHGWAHSNHYINVGEVQRVHPQELSCEGTRMSLLSELQLIPVQLRREQMDFTFPPGFTSKCEDRAVLTSHLLCPKLSQNSWNHSKEST